MRVLRRTVLVAVVVVVVSVGVLVGGVSVAFGAPVYSNGCSSLGWPALCTSGEFVEPLGVAVDNSAGASNGDVYVVVYTPTPEVLEFNANGERTGLAPVRGPGGRELQLPLFDAVDSSTGDFYVDDYLGGVVDKFKPDGELEEGFGTSGQVTGLATPTGVAVQQSTGHVFVALRGSEEVAEYTSAGAFLGSFKTALNPLDSVAVDSAGDVYVDQEGGAVEEYPAGKRTEPVTVVGGGADAVAVDESTGRVFVSQGGGQQIGEYEPGGTLVEVFAAGELGGQGSFGVGVNEATHAVYVSDRSDGLGGIYTLGPPRLTLTVAKPGTGSGEVVSTPVGVACGPHCQAGFQENATVTLKATAAAGSVFARWGGCEAEPGGECEVTMSAAKTVTAVFNEVPSAPRIEGESATSIAASTATLTGSLNPRNETPTACAFHYALEVPLLASSPSVAECEPPFAQLGSGNTGEPVSAKLEGLQANTVYFYRLTAANNVGPAEGPIEEFLTLPNPPTVQTLEASALTPYTAVINATVNPGASGHAAQDDTTYQFQYSTDETFSSQTPIADAHEGTTPLEVHAQLEGLAPGTIYHYRILATNNNTGTPQTTTGEPHTFTTIPTPPILTGAGATQVSSSSALITATLQTQGLPTRWELQLATNPAALQYNAAGNTSSPEAEPVGVQLENLQPNTTYYYKLTAENPDGNTETTEAAFTTLPGASPTPIVTSPTSAFPILGVPPNIFPTETKITSTTPKKTTKKCPKGSKRTKQGRCVKIKRKGKRAKKGRTH
jgi:hypothetical protein